MLWYITYTIYFWSSNLTGQIWKVNSKWFYEWWMSQWIIHKNDLFKTHWFIQEPNKWLLLLGTHFTLFWWANKGGAIAQLNLETLNHGSKVCHSEGPFEVASFMHFGPPISRPWLFSHQIVIEWGFESFN